MVSTPVEVQEFIEHLLRVNLDAVAQGRAEDKLVPCVWGAAGIAKTSLYKQLEYSGFEYKGETLYPKVIVKHLAEIEESGDIQGLPELATDANGNRVTNYAPPKWWPTQADCTDAKGNPRPCILVIDDFNRADPRILKAIMGLLQFGRMSTASLPDLVTIGLTANPPEDDDQTSYMVNEVDKAILTRMAHITMRFDKECWGSWAEKNGIDSRVISFAFRYPEMINGSKGERTNPRSLTYFAQMIKSIPDLKGKAGLVARLSRSTLDEEVATTFEKFVIGDLQDIVEPAMILNDWKTAEKKFEVLKKKSSKGKEDKLRTDIMGIILDRLYVYLMQPSLAGKLTTTNFQGFLNFIQRGDLIPEDAVYNMLRRLRRDAKSPEQKKMFADMVKFGGPEIAKLIMSIS
jgi:hypothetical protein